jgi:hypothetical protein
MLGNQTKFIALDTPTIFLRPKQDFGNTWLEHIHEVVMPDSISLIPSAPFWFLLIVMASLYSAWNIWGVYCRWKINSYRRAAKKMTERLQERFLGGDYLALRELPEIIRRSALSVWPREVIVALVGNDWNVFLASSLADPCATNDEILGVTQLAYLSDESLKNISVDEANKYFSWVTYWLVNHNDPEREA